MSDNLREHRLMPNLLRTLKGDRQLADQIIDEVEDSIWLAEVVVRRVAEAKAEALNEVADFLDGRGVLWHGDSGVTVMGQPYSGQFGVRLTDWLRAQAVASEGTG